MHILTHEKFEASLILSQNRNSDDCHKVLLQYSQIYLDKKMIAEKNNNSVTFLKHKVIAVEEKDIALKSYNKIMRKNS